MDYCALLIGFPVIASAARLIAIRGRNFTIYLISGEFTVGDAREIQQNFAAAG